MKFKIIWNNDIRIFQTKSSNWDEILPSIRTFVEQSFGIHDFNATYIDEEDENITISRTSDLEDALERYKVLKKMPRFHITIKKKMDTNAAPAMAIDAGLVSELAQEHRKRLLNEAKLNKQKEKGEWLVEPAILAMNTVNRIRAVVDQIDMTQIPPNKEFISIAIGDPTKFPNLLPSPTVTKTVQNKLLSQQSNGYTMSYGLKAA
eukprot:UN08385